MRARHHPSGRRLWIAGSSLLVLAAMLIGILVGERPAAAGGPLVVGGRFGPSGVPFTFDTSLGEVQYRTDGGGLGLLSNTTANSRVASMFQVWEDVPTASIGFNRAGPIMNTGAFTDGNVSTMAELNAVEGSCSAGTQSPIIYDKDGSLFEELFGPGSGVIGFASVCELSPAGRILTSVAALNGAFRDDLPANDELTDNEFDAVFIHEFGHLFGMDHSQINLNCLSSQGGCVSGSDDAFGLPTMFPFLIQNLTESPEVHPARTLSQDDIAWVSRLYPQNFSSSFGVISGTVLFSDGVTHAQGVNIVAREVGSPRRTTVSVVSGYLFTGNPGQSVTGTNNGSSFGSRDPLLIGTFDIPVPPGTYTVEVESVFSEFTLGSSVGPLDPPMASPGANEFWDLGESPVDLAATSSPVSVSAGATVTSINIILNGTPPRFDQFESAGLSLPGQVLSWLGKGMAAAYRLVG
ncbi:MAG: hypothetical protein HY656_00195 [Acidobacteria bacterium]|nr:hypothetical protein [Acidobacteriota bacterium]